MRLYNKESRRGKNADRKFHKMPTGPIMVYGIGIRAGRPNGPPFD